MQTSFSKNNDHFSISFLRVLKLCEPVTSPFAIEEHLVVPLLIQSKGRTGQSMTK